MILNPYVPKVASLHEAMYVYLLTPTQNRANSAV